ncbi:hypothetical protein CsSME_00049186 [Camellia sinensis var. sinensis]
MSSALLSTRSYIFVILLVSYQRIASPVGTFGRVLECWDRHTREYVAVKVVRSIRKYREAAMVEIEVLQQLAKNDEGGSRCVQIRNWFDYRNHICIVSIPVEFILFVCLLISSSLLFVANFTRKLCYILPFSVGFLYKLVDLFFLGPCLSSSRIRATCFWDILSLILYFFSFIIACFYFF